MTTATQTLLTDVSPETLEQWLADGNTALIDVREDFEHAEQRIDGAQLAPLSVFDPDKIRESTGDQRVVFHCRSGKRSADAAERFAREGERVFHLAGGIEGWIAAGKSVIRPATAQRIPVMRQVQIAAGSLVALGIALGVTVSPWFLSLAAFIGCGLVFAGITGWCGMAKLLSAMPWNRTPARA